MPLRNFIFALVLGLSFPSGLLAQDSAAALAEQLVTEGVALRRAGDDEGALACFLESLAIAPTARALAQLALAELALSRWVPAETHLSEALASGEPWIVERRPMLQEQLASIRGHLGRIEVVIHRASREGPPVAIDFEGGDFASTILLDGRPVTRLSADAPIWVEPGSHTLEVRAPGFQLLSQTVLVDVGEVANVVMTLVPLPPAPPPQPPRSAPPVFVLEVSAPEPAPGASTPPPRVSAPVARSPARPRAVSRSSTPRSAPIASSTSAFPPSVWRPIGWSAVGGGALGLALSAALLSARNDAADSFNGERCLAGGRSRRENCGSVYYAAQAWEARSIASFVVGLLLAGGGAAVLLLVPSAEARGTGATTSARTTIRCAPLAEEMWGGVCDATF